jgi:serine/threonine protein kinase
MITGQYPFQSSSMSQLLSNISNLPPRLNPEKISPELLDLLQKVLVKDPEQRLTITQIKNHKWFDNFRYKCRLETVLQEYSNFHAVNEEIAKQMNLTDHQCALLQENLVMRSLDLETITYRILFKEKISKYVRLLSEHDDENIPKFRDFFKVKKYSTIIMKHSLSFLFPQQKTQKQKNPKRGKMSKIIIVSNQTPNLRSALTGSKKHQ